MTIFSGNKDIDFLILMQLNDYELSQVFKINKYLNSFCNNKNFWFNRLHKNIETSLNEKIALYLKFSKKKDDINKYIEIAKEFYGFNDNKEFYKFLKNIIGKHLKLYFYVIIYSFSGSLFLNSLYEINKDELPKWLNYKEFIFLLRRKLIEKSFSKVIKGEELINIYSPFKKEILGFKLKGKQFKMIEHNMIKKLLSK